MARGGKIIYLISEKAGLDHQALSGCNFLELSHYTSDSADAEVSHELTKL